MKYSYTYQTKAGTFQLLEKQGRWHAMFQGESLGTYSSPQKAADDLSGGHTFMPSSGVDPGKLGIPADLPEWERIAVK